MGLERKQTAPPYSEVEFDWNVWLQDFTSVTMRNEFIELSTMVLMENVE